MARGRDEVDGEVIMVDWRCDQVRRMQAAAQPRRYFRPMFMHSFRNECIFTVLLKGLLAAFAI
jgi:hypothetical protein